MRPKRLINLLVAVCMMITMLPLSAVTAFAADTSTEQEASYKGYKYAYTVNGGNATITKFLGPDDSANPVDSASTVSYDIEIPEKLGIYTVTGLGKDSFTGYPFAGDWYKFGRNIRSITIPQSVTSIGDQAFYYCTALTEITIPQSVTFMGDRAFTGCAKLNSLTIDDAAISIGDWAFAECYVLSKLSLGKKIKTIGDHAFFDCRILDNVTIPQSVTSIGPAAFARCYELTTLSLGENIETIGDRAFEDCWDLTNVTIPEKVETINPDTFAYCSRLKYITLPAGLTSFKDRLISCPAGYIRQASQNGAIYYNNYKAAADALRDNPDALLENNNVLAKRNFLYLCKVTFDANGGKLNDDAEVPVYKTEKITNTKANELTAIHDPTRAGYKFTGWYTKDDQLFKVDDTEIMEDITLHAGWDFDPNASGCHPLTLKDGVITSVTVPGKNGADPEDITEIVKKNANEDGSFNVPEGATVSVAFDKDAFADSGLKFGHWDITGLDDPNAYQNKESFAFVMPAKGVTLKAMTQDASIEDDEPDIVGPIVIGTTVVVGGAVLGYQAYSLGAEFAGKLMALPYFPSNRSALAMMLWEDAGKPMPESELLYPDVGQEEQDMDLQHAARWAMENDLVPDLNDEGTAPEEMKFYPDNTVSKIDVLKAWQKAQELKQNA